MRRGAAIRAHYGHYSSNLVMAKVKGFVTSWSTDFCPNLRRPESLSICRCLDKGSTLSGTQPIELTRRQPEPSSHYARPIMRLLFTFRHTWHQVVLVCRTTIYLFLVFPLVLFSYRCIMHQCACLTIQWTYNKTFPGFVADEKSYAA